MATFQAYAHDTVGNEVKIGPSLSNRRAVLNSLINHVVDGEVRDDTGIVTDRVTVDEHSRYHVENVVELPEPPAPVRTRREGPPRKKVSW